MNDFRTKNCQVCSKEYLPTSPNQKYCLDCRLIVKNIRDAKWNKAHPEKCKAYLLSFRERCPNYNSNWAKANRPKQRLSGRKGKAKRRGFGHVYLNVSFAGCEGHHVDNEQVINMPRKLHHSIYHNQHTGQGMAQMNAIAYNFLFKQEVETAIAAKETS
jgi:hypothetical protein